MGSMWISRETEKQKTADDGCIEHSRNGKGLENWKEITKVERGDKDDER